MSRLARLIQLDTQHRDYYEREAFRAGACVGLIVGIIAGWLVVGLVAIIVVGWRIV